MRSSSKVSLRGELAMDGRSVVNRKGKTTIHKAAVFG